MNTEGKAFEIAAKIGGWILFILMVVGMAASAV